MKTRHTGQDATVQIEHTKGRQYRSSNVFFIGLMGLASLGYGLSAAIIGTTLAQPYFLEYMGLLHRSDATQLIAATNGLYQAGGLLSCLIFAPLADRWGRKPAIMASAVLVIVSGALLGGSAHIGMFITFRFFNGAGAFLLLALVPVWMAEVSPPAVRGAMVVIHGVSLGFGYALAQWIGFAFLHVHSNASWRVPLVFQCFPLLILLACSKWIPESPRFALMQDDADGAQRILKQLHSPEEAMIEFAQISRQVAVDKTLPSSWLAIIRKTSYRKRFLIALVLSSSTQMVGTLVINNYGPEIFEGLGYDLNSQFIMQASSVTAGFVVAPIAVWIVDRMPRNRLVGLAEYCCIACVIVEAALAATQVPSNNKSGLRAAVAMLFLFFAFFNGGVDCSVYAYISELFPTHLRIKGMAFAVAGINVTDLILLQSAPTAFQNIGWKWYLCFAIPAFVMATVILFFFPDTWGVPLEEVAAIFGDRDELYHFDDEERQRATVTQGEKDIGHNRSDEIEQAL